MIKVNNQGTPEIIIYEDIGEGFFGGGVTAKSISDGLKEHKGAKNIDVRINSYGGSVFEGLAIYNQLKQHKASINVYIDGIAASIASVIAMAGDKITMAENGWFMIHDPWGFAVGTAEELRAEAAVLDNIKGSIVDTYAKRTDSLPEFISGLMADETWMNAEQAIDNGFADETEDSKLLAASANTEILKHIKRMPVQLKDYLESRKTKNLDASKVISAKMQTALNKRLTA